MLLWDERDGGKSVGEEHTGGLRYIRVVCYVIL